MRDDWIESSELRVDAHRGCLQVAYPLITLLFSLEDDKHFLNNIDSQMDLIMRSLRVSAAAESVLCTLH